MPRRPWFAAACALAILLVMPAGARAAMSWSGPKSLSELNQPGMAAVACPSATECVAVEGPPLPLAPRADEVTFDPSTPSRWTAYTVDRGNTPTAVACASNTSCTAVESGGREVSFDPGAAGRALAYTIDRGHTLRAVACPSARQCTALDGDGRELTFDPAAPHAPRAVQVDGRAATAIACPSSAQCSLVDGFGRVVTFDPADPAGPAGPAGPASQTKPPIVATLGNAYFSGIACPTIGECVATGAFSCVTSQCAPSADLGQEVTFDPQSTGSPIASAGTRFALEGVACPSTKQCTAMDESGQEVTFNPATPGTTSEARIDGPNYPKGPNPSAISCSALAQCTVVDLVFGSEVSFNPRAPGRPRPVSVATGAPNVGLACPAPGSCTAVAIARGSYQPGPGGVVVTFDALAGRQRQPFSILAQTPTAVACASPVQCAVVEAGGTEYTFNPGRPPAAVDAHSAALHRIDSGGLTSIACPSVRQCTAVDNRGHAVTFDPGRSQGAVSTRIDATGLASIACPSLGQCTAVDTRGREVTFIPGTPSVAITSPIDSASLTSISCPSLGQCAAVDVLGREVTFDPGMARDAKLTRIDNTRISKRLLSRDHVLRRRRQPRRRARG